MLVCLSCSDDDDGGKAGDISFYGETYPLELGAVYHDNNHTVIAIEDYVFEDSYVVEGKTQTDVVEGFTAEMKNGQTGNFLIGLYEGGIVLSDLTQDARGNGAAICLRLASPETERVVPGKYTFSLSHDEFTFMGYSSANYSPGGDVTPNELAEGEVNVAQEGDVYTIDFDCKTTFGGEIRGTYTGTLKAFARRSRCILPTCTGVWQILPRRTSISRWLTTRRRKPFISSRPSRCGRCCGMTLTKMKRCLTTRLICPAIRSICRRLLISRTKILKRWRNREISISTLQKPVQRFL